jgi:hypothetical protein
MANGRLTLNKELLDVPRRLGEYDSPMTHKLLA